jgi:putative endonuclease
MPCFGGPNAPRRLQAPLSFSRSLPTVAFAEVGLLARLRATSAKPPLDSLTLFARSWQALNAACVVLFSGSESRGVPEQAHDRESRGTPNLYNQAVFHVYMVRCADGTLYTGYAHDPGARVEVHNSGKGAKYTRSRLPVSLVYVEQCESLSAALKRERQLKPWSRARKEALIAGNQQALKRA